MPLTDKGEKISKAMVEEYGKEKGEKVFYASRNAGTITGVDSPESNMDPVGNISASLTSGQVAEALGSGQRISGRSRPR